MPDVFFKNTKTGKRYQILNMDGEKGEVTLKGEYSEFTEKYSKERFKALGYVLDRGGD